VRFTDYEVLSFDCYGTLVNWEAGIAAVLSPWAKSRGLTLSEEQLLTAYSTHEATAEAGHPADPYPSILARSLRALGTELDAAVSDQDAAALSTSVPDWPVFADSHDALEALGQHFKLIILSNVDRASFAASKARLGVEFTSVLTAQDIGSYKPSPRNFTALIQEVRRLGIADGKLLHVAQSLFHDHIGAKQAGLPTVWINRRHDRPGWGATPAPPADVTPDAEFPSMAAFAAAVQSE
jgi:2-haloalkanoic acid dehalogenase type II